MPGVGRPRRTKKAQSSVGFVDDDVVADDEPAADDEEVEEVEDIQPSQVGARQVKRRNLISKVVKEKASTEEEEAVDELTEDALLKAGKSFTAYALFLVIFVVPSWPLPSASPAAGTRACADRRVSRRCGR